MTISKDEAEFLAITALQFIAENPDRLARFFALNGLTPAQLENALDPDRNAGRLFGFYANGSQTYWPLSLMPISPRTSHASPTGSHGRENR